jgi:hypothetical protein
VPHLTLKPAARAGSVTCLQHRVRRMESPEMGPKRAQMVTGRYIYSYYQFGPSEAAARRAFQAGLFWATINGRECSLFLLRNPD